MNNRYLLLCCTLVLAAVASAASTLPAQEVGRGAKPDTQVLGRVHPDPQPYKHFAWVIDTAALDGGPTRILRRPGKRPQDIILVSRAATGADLLLATRSLDVMRAVKGDAIPRGVDVTPRGELNLGSREVQRGIIVMDGVLGSLRASALQHTEDFGEVRLAAMELKPPGHLKGKDASRGKP